LRARPGVLVIDIFVGLALVALVLAAAGIILPLWGAAIGVVGVLTVVVGGAEWVLWRVGAMHHPRVSPPLRRALHRLLRPLPPRQPTSGAQELEAPEPLAPGHEG
jgi:predicted lysophospholipase L1 biosynthesis ABC-type transport system permease subunit